MGVYKIERESVLYRNGNVYLLLFSNPEIFRVRLSRAQLDHIGRALYIGVVHKDKLFNVHLKHVLYNVYTKTLSQIKKKPVHVCTLCVWVCAVLLLFFVHTHSNRFGSCNWQNINPDRVVWFVRRGRLIFILYIYMYVCVCDFPYVCRLIVDHDLYIHIYVCICSKKR